MICSASELGLGEDHTGILVLDRLGVAGPDDVGRDLEAVLPLSDVVLDITVTPRSTRCHVGPRDRPRTSAPTTSYRCATPIPLSRRPGLITTSGCRWKTRWGARASVARQVSEVAIAASPAARAASSPSRRDPSISNVVDGNYVMVEMGHPIHAFDMERIAEGRLIIRRAHAGEQLRTLDGVDRELLAEDIVVADPSGPVALAGVMGGESTEVGDHQPGAGRGGQLGSSERARHRPPSRSPLRGIRPVRAWRRPRSLRGGRGTSRRNGGSARWRTGPQGSGRCLPGARRDRARRASPVRGRAASGSGFDETTVSQLLTRLGFEVATQDDERLEVLVPTRRPDVTRPVDLIEEVARLYGYDRIPSRVRMGSNGTIAPEQRAERAVREAMMSAGYSEAQSISSCPEDLDLLRLPGDDPRRDAISVSNPLREEESLLRTTLLPGLLRAAAGNIIGAARRCGALRDRQGLPPHSIGARSTAPRAARPPGVRRRRRAGDPGILGHSARGRWL